jgi:hypothetical protein
MELLDHIDKLTSAELAELILVQQKVLEEAKAVVDRAKTVAKSRRTAEGMELHGDVAMVFTPSKKFDPKTAAGALKPSELASICVPKPDATMAKKVLGEHSPQYQACLKDHGYSLTVREANDSDRLVALAMANPAERENTEDFELDSSLL